MSTDKPATTTSTTKAVPELTPKQARAVNIVLELMKTLPTGPKCPIEVQLRYKAKEIAGHVAVNPSDLLNRCPAYKTAMWALLSRRAPETRELQSVKLPAGLRSPQPFWSSENAEGLPNTAGHMRKLGISLLPAYKDGLRLVTERIGTTAFVIKLPSRAEFNDLPIPYSDKSDLAVSVIVSNEWICDHRAELEEFFKDEPAEGSAARVARHPTCGGKGPFACPADAAAAAEAATDAAPAVAVVTPKHTTRGGKAPRKGEAKAKATTTTIDVPTPMESKTTETDEETDDDKPAIRKLTTKKRKQTTPTPTPTTDESTPRQTKKPKTKKKKTGEEAKEAAPAAAATTSSPSTAMPPLPPTAVASPAPAAAAAAAAAPESAPATPAKRKRSRPASGGFTAEAVATITELLKNNQHILNALVRIADQRDRQVADMVSIVRALLGTNVAEERKERANLVDTASDCRVAAETSAFAVTSLTKEVESLRLQLEQRIENRVTPYTPRGGPAASEPDVKSGSSEMDLSDSAVPHANTVLVPPPAAAAAAAAAAAPAAAQAAAPAPAAAAADTDVTGERPISPPILSGGETLAIFDVDEQMRLERERAHDRPFFVTPPPSQTDPLTESDHLDITVTPPTPAAVAPHPAPASSSSSSRTAQMHPLEG